MVGVEITSREVVLNKRGVIGARSDDGRFTRLAYENKELSPVALQTISKIGIPPHFRTSIALSAWGTTSLEEAVKNGQQAFLLEWKPSGFGTASDVNGIKLAGRIIKLGSYGEVHQVENRDSVCGIRIGAYEAIHTDDTKKPRYTSKKRMLIVFDKDFSVRTKATEAIKAGE